LDTYSRERERYGNKLIEPAESIFYYDSECILSILKKIRNENYRWMIALKMIDALLSDFSFDINAKKDIIDKISNSFKVEFGFNQYNAKQFNSKYRDNKKNIENIINSTIADVEFKTLYLPVQKKSKNLKLIIEKLNNTKKVEKDNLISSYIHMMLNRLFQSKNRMHELVLYDFMKRYYTSSVARNKNIN
jgi:thiopeptide-type bacteriocin biosynthesis protein